MSKAALRKFMRYSRGEQVKLMARPLELVARLVAPPEFSELEQWQFNRYYVEEQRSIADDLQNGSEKQRDLLWRIRGTVADVLMNGRHPLRPLVGLTVKQGRPPDPDPEFVKLIFMLLAMIDGHSQNQALTLAWRRFHPYAEKLPRELERLLARLRGPVTEKGKTRPRIALGGFGQFCEVWYVPDPQKPDAEMIPLPQQTLPEYLRDNPTPAEVRTRLEKYLKAAGVEPPPKPG